MEGSPVYDFNDIYEKSSLEGKSPENEFYYSHSHTDACTDEQMRESPVVHTSTPLEQTDKFHFKEDDKTLDKTIDEAIDKYETAFQQNVGKLKDVSVQTPNDTPGTINKQCQCDLGLAEGPPLKKLKLNICGYLTGDVDWKTNPSELSQDEGNRSKYLESEMPNSHTKMSRIRVGLSKRVRPPPLHPINQCLTLLNANKNA